MFKYNLNQIVWYLLDGDIHSAPILSRKYIDNKTTTACTEAQKDLFEAFGKAGIQYSTVHAILSEDRIFGSKEELLQNL